MTVIAEFGSSPAAGGWKLDPWIESAAYAGADAVKVQLFRATHFPESEWASKRPLEFPRERLLSLVLAAHAYGMQCGASVFDEEAVQLAVPRCDFIKLAAREEYNYKLFDLVSSVRYFKNKELKPIVRSVSDWTNIIGGKGIITLFAIQQYPAPMWLSVWNLWRASRYFKSLGIYWGWSSHTKGILDCVLAARWGARIIEKHLALTDHDIEAGHSLLPDAFGRMVADIRG